MDNKDIKRALKRAFKEGYIKGCAHDNEETYWGTDSPDYVWNKSNIKKWVDKNFT